MSSPSEPFREPRTVILPPRLLSPSPEMQARVARLSAQARIAADVWRLSEGRLAADVTIMITHRGERIRAELSRFDDDSGLIVTIAKMEG